MLGNMFRQRHTCAHADRALTGSGGCYRLTSVNEMIIIKPKTGYCINCDNRHGCKSKTPPCIMEMAEHGVSGRSGKQYLTECEGLHLCKDCPFFRSCWNPEDYNRLAGQPGGRPRG